jgi:diguanylate cyclase (GGDEF)-like protein
MIQTETTFSTHHEHEMLHANPVEPEASQPKMEAPTVSGNITTLDKQRSESSDVLANAKVMIVSDDTLNAEVMSGFLKRFGYNKIILSSKISEVFDIIFNERPDVILFENTMLNKADFEVLGKIRNNTTTRQIPIVILTAVAEQSTKLQALELGVIDVLIKPASANELALRLRNILEVKNYHEHIASHDLLTNLPNREAFLTRLEWALKYSKRYNTTGAVLQLGLSRFKNVNDAFGPMSADRLLKIVANRINNVLHESDIVTRVEDENAELIASRSGGDEFSILLPIIKKVESAALIAKKLQQQIAEPFHINGKELNTACNIGISIFPDDGTSKETVLHGAVAALHQANQHIDSSYTFYSKELNSESVNKIDITNDLRKALKEDQFSMFYQPKIDVSTGKLIGAEALIRWQHPERGNISPADFILLAEESGDILAMGKWIINSVCQQIGKWQSTGAKVPRIAINISAHQFKNNQLIEDVKSSLADASINANHLDIELTESAVMNNVKESIAILDTLKEMGAKISIDDFGTGYSSLSQLKQLPLDELKIDRSFITDIGSENNNDAIILAIISMARSLGLNVVAEGVETKEQLNFIKKHKCNVYQGYLFSPAVSADDFGLMLKSEELKGKTDRV